MQRILHVVKELLVLGDTLYLIIGALALLAMASIAHADVTPGEADRYCRTYAKSIGGEVSVQPLEIDGPTWTSTSGRSIPGNGVLVRFADETISFVDQSPSMADHILTILAHRLKNQEVIAVRFDNDGKKEYMMFLPLVTSLAAANEPSCYMVGLSK